MSTAVTSPKEAEKIAQRFREVFARIAPGAVEREREHRLPREEVAELAALGFGALRIPIADGGAGLSIPQAARIWVDAAAADSSLPQIFRGQFAIVEDRVHTSDDSREDWLRRFLDGEIVGNSWSEASGSTTASPSTRLVSTPEGLRLRGRKYYTTGSIFAQWTDATAADDSGETVAVLVPTDDPGVSVSDDWNGFGQQLTGTGTILFDDVPVDPGNVIVLTDRFSYQTALYQLVLLVVQAGIARRAAEDAADAVRARTRVYSHGLASRARDDGQILAVIGQVRSAAFAAEAVVDRAAAALQRASDLEPERGSEAQRAALAEAELATAEGQVVLAELVPEAVTRLFNALGASGTSNDLGLDRHWRNTRTVSSHNPVIYKQRIIGDHLVNGADPLRLWGVGTAAAADGQGATADPAPEHRPAETREAVARA